MGNFQQSPLQTKGGDDDANATTVTQLFMINI